MHIAHIFACGMGGIRTAGDLVAWMQLIKKMKLAKAKKYVAKKDLGIGTTTSVAGSPKGIRAKLKISELLEVPINSVELFKSQIG
jgi:dimethylamine--corrinoid protein Co-methyltransferase